jgi:hypothetical protein
MIGHRFALLRRDVCSGFRTRGKNDAMAFDKSALCKAEPGFRRFAPTSGSFCLGSALPATFNASFGDAGACDDPGGCFHSAIGRDPQCCVRAVEDSGRGVRSWHGYRRAVPSICGQSDAINPGKTQNRPAALPGWRNPSSLDRAARRAQQAQAHCAVSGYGAWDGAIERLRPTGPTGLIQGRSPAYAGRLCCSHLAGNSTKARSP